MSHLLELGMTAGFDDFCCFIYFDHNHSQSSEQWMSAELFLHEIMFHYTEKGVKKGASVNATDYL